MRNFFLQKILPLVAAVVVLWLSVKYLLPVALPFLLGGAVALMAEPAVKRLEKWIGRTAGAVVGVSLALCVLAVAVSFLGAVLWQQMIRLASGIPQLADTAKEGLVTVRNWVTDLSEKAPRQLKPVMQRTVSTLFSDGTVVLEQMTRQLPGVVTTAIGTVGSGLIGLGTGALAAFLISGRLPKLKAYFGNSGWVAPLRPAAVRVWGALGGWLKAQLKLCAVTWGIVSAGFLLLRIPNGILWAAAVAIVDAVPILGTGTVLLPWAAISLLRGENLTAIGLLCTYGAAFLTRSVLEPRMVGSQLGLDPLTTLAALYAGYRFWGFAGLLLTPVLASAIKSFLTAK